jgi:hypothetical protein
LSYPSPCTPYAAPSLFLCKQKLIIDRDDLTVEVIFFGDGEKSGDVVLNKEASASAGDAKAKL